MLDSNRGGFAVMNKELTSYSFEDESLETCKKYCRKGDVIARQLPYKAGFSIKVMWYKWHKPFQFKYQHKNIFWLHWSVNNEYLHKTCEIVYRNE